MNNQSPGALPLSNPITGWFAGAGRTTRITLEHAGGLGLLFWQIVLAIVRLKVSLCSILNQMYIMGVQSLPIVLVTGSLAGIVTSQQGGYQMTSAMPSYVLGSLVVETVVLEMGPVLTALVLVGRIGARITAELGTMVAPEASHSVLAVPDAYFTADPPV